MTLIDENGFRWEALSEDQYMWLLLHDYVLPDGYQSKTCTVALSIPPIYPALEIDMAYFSPQLAMRSGKAIQAITIQSIDQQPFQRWSLSQSRGLETRSRQYWHDDSVNNWLESELNR